MKAHCRLILFSLIATWSVTTLAEVHPEVQAALDWQFPENACKTPKLKRSGDLTTAKRKYKKQVKRFKKCIANYEAGLVEENEKLKAVAAHGLTEAQTEIILGHMYKIRWVQENGLAAAAKLKQSGTQMPKNEEDFILPRYDH